MIEDFQKKTALPDIQSTRDERNIAIDKVGVTAVSFPIQFASSSESLVTPAQHTIANFDLFVSLPKDERGTHMSRFLQVFPVRWRRSAVEVRERHRWFQRDPDPDAA